MALLNGFLPSAVLHSQINPHIARDLNRFEGIAGWPGGCSKVSGAPTETTLTHWPVETSPTVIQASHGHGFAEDFYNRIHVSPHVLHLGNIASTQSSSLRVWNAFLGARQLDAVGIGAEGVDLGGQPLPPLVFSGLQEREYFVSVTPDGEPVLDTSISWIFDNGEAPSLRITASRIIAWSFAPDWADGVEEVLEWLTDIMSSETLVEQRRALRIAPRRYLKASMYVEGRERSLLDLALFGWGARVWALPIWPDIQLLQQPISQGAMRIPCSTQYLDFRAGGLAMLRGESAFEYEVVEILAIDANGLDLKRGTQRAWGSGARLYPTRAAQLVEQPQLTRLTDTLQSAAVQFLLLDPSDWGAALPAETYRGRPVLERAPDESEDLTGSYSRLISTLDNTMSRPQLTDLASRALQVQRWRWVDLGRGARAELRALLYALRGQQVPIWLPTHSADLEVVVTITALSTTLDIAWIGYTRFSQSAPGRRDIRIQLTNGTVFYRRITNSTELDEQTERLAINAALGVLVEPRHIARISWMSLCRLSDDRVEFRHETDSEGLATCALTFRGVRDDEFY